MLIPVFVSMPNTLNEQQRMAQQLVLGELGHHGIEARTLGRTDYPTSFPLREVLTLALGGQVIHYIGYRLAGGPMNPNLMKEGTTLYDREGRRVIEWTTRQGSSTSDGS